MKDDVKFLGFGISGKEYYKNIISNKVFSVARPNNSPINDKRRGK